MNKLNIKLSGSLKVNPVITVDGKRQKLKKNEFGSYMLSHETEKNKVELCVFKYLEISGRFWLIFHILFFVISCFGIFDIWPDRRCVVINCKFNIEITENTKVLLKFNKFEDKGRAIEVESNNTVEEISNVYYVDKKAKTRTKVLTALKIVMIIALVVSLFVLI